jgi:hypothetical protein
LTINTYFNEHIYSYFLIKCKLKITTGSLATSCGVSIKDYEQLIGKSFIAIVYEKIVLDSTHDHESDRRDCR